MTVVHAPVCYFCDDAQRALVELVQQFPLAVELVDAGGPTGEALVRRHRAPMYPLILVDGEFFSFGRLPRKKLCRLLAARASAVVA